MAVRPSLEGQAQGPIQNPIEMGKQSYKEIIDRLRKIPGYREQFQKVFGTNVTLDGMAKAIATFERVAALSGNSTYDKYKAGDTKALSDSEKRGMVLFGLRLNPDDEFKTDVVLQKAKCTLCHVGFNFTDEQFHNLGIGWDAKQDAKFADLGRWAIEPDRRQVRRQHGGVQDADGPRHRAAPRPTCTTAAWRRSKRCRALRQGRQRQPGPRPGHEEAEPDRPGEGRRRRLHEGADRRDARSSTSCCRRCLPAPTARPVDPRPAPGTPGKKVAAVFHPSPRQ